MCGVVLYKCINHHITEREHSEQDQLNNVKTCVCLVGEQELVNYETSKSFFSFNGNLKWKTQDIAYMKAMLSSWRDLGGLSFDRVPTLGWLDMSTASCFLLLIYLLGLFVIMEEAP